MQSPVLPFGMWWQQIPQNLEPIALEIGGIPIYWYSLFFLLGAGGVYWAARRKYLDEAILTKQQYQDFAFWVFVSALLGGKLGFLLLYWWPFVQINSETFIPRVNGSIALPGMSFVGGAIAVSLFIFWYAKKKQKNFFLLTDTLVLYVPVGIFLGRIGNFFHNELWGRVTTMPWGMYFPGSSILRHPSALYGALLEGALLFVILSMSNFFFFEKKKIAPGIITSVFCIFYGILRFASECFREPDSQIGYVGNLTFNQVFAIIFFVVGVIFLTIKKRKNNVY